MEELDEKIKNIKERSEKISYTENIIKTKTKLKSSKESMFVWVLSSLSVPIEILGGGLAGIVCLKILIFFLHIKGNIFAYFVFGTIGLLGGLYGAFKKMIIETQKDTNDDI